MIKPDDKCQSEGCQTAHGMPRDNELCSNDPNRSRLETDWFSKTYLIYRINERLGVRFGVQLLDDICKRGHLSQQNDKRNVCALVITIE